MLHATEIANTFLAPADLALEQQRRLAAMLRAVLPTNRFYAAKLGRGVPLESVRLVEFPFTTRAELQADQLAHPPYGTNLTYPRDVYVRLHQTSGSSLGPAGQPAPPLRWLDTPESWNWFKDCWRVIYGAAGVTPTDRLFFPFSFGPFVGFWAAFEAAVDLGNFCLPAGGMTTAARLQHLMENEATVVCCTPTYALRLAVAAAEAGIDLAVSAVRALIVAGEPGGSIPETKQRIEEAWGARVFDHTGMTEIGSCSFECVERPGGVHVIETEFIPEVIDPATGAPLSDGECGELVLTNLGRIGSPLIRYRTGDLARLIRERCACGRWFAWLPGGILGRCDDMVTVRGNNVFPSAVEGVVRMFAEIREFRVEIGREKALTDLRLVIEPKEGENGRSLGEKVAAAFRDRFHFRPEVEVVAPGTLPRFEMKARRFVIRGGAG